jgi:uncharacterized cupredoxin-like copper-binding protein
MKAAVFLLLLAGASPAAAIDWRQAREVELRLTGFDVTPATMRLKAGQPVRVRLVNASRGAFRMDARDFLAAATIRTRDARAIEDGVVRVAAGRTVELSLVPRAGRYKIGASSFIYRILGMRGNIVVE